MISNIRLQNFRSYNDAAFEFDNSVNVIVGPNAFGKTNLLEAVLVVSKGVSYRAKDIDLISFNQPWARLEANNEGHNIIIKIEADKKPTKTFEIDNKKLLRLLAPSKIPLVLFEPSHLSLLTGSPEARRNYLDDLIEQFAPGYSSLKRKYLRALSQRNSLLKNIHNNQPEHLFPWNVRLSQLGGQIISFRKEAVETINKLLPNIYSDLSGSSIVVTIEYKSQLPLVNYESHHLQALERSVNEDLRSGFTSYGPHRDDFIIRYDNHPANIYASRGEMRTAVLALKIVELDVIEKETSKKPIFLLDDVFSELDGHRRHALIDKLSGFQSFITTTDADIVVQQLAGKSNVLALNQD